MHYLFVDFETTRTKDISLERMTLRKYLAVAAITGMSWAEDDGPIRYVNGCPPKELVEHFESLCASNDWTWVSHNAAFDVRVARFKLGLAQPQHVHCTLELSMCAWPNQPGGYGLKNLAHHFNLPPKLEIDLKEGQYTKDELEEYCKRDTLICRELHKLCSDRVPENELEIAEMANRLRELHFVIDPSKVEAALVGFTKAAADSVAETMQYLDADGEDQSVVQSFGWIRYPGTLGPDDPGVPKSLKPAKIKALLLERLGFDTKTITYKKINPTHLSANPQAASAVKHASNANKAFSHQRRVAVFSAAEEVDAELGFYRAHTGRFSSPSVGRGLNLHNQPKNNKAIAKPIRQMFEVPDGLCLVRGDAANVEYRIEGWLTRCSYIENLFRSNILADPYSEFGLRSTGIHTTKKDPARQLFKTAVLGLGFIMGVGTWMANLMLLISDPANGVTLADLDAVCQKLGWLPPTDGWVLAQQKRLNAPWQVAAVAYQTRKAFHEIHPEFEATAKWLMYAVQHVSSAVDHELAIDYCYRLGTAPDRNRLELSFDRSFEGPTIRVRCGDWTPTVCWRHLGLADTPFGFAFASVQAGNKGFRKFTPNIAIENVTQSAARNALCMAKRELHRLGWQYILSVHDEIMIVCNRDRETVLAARDDLLKVAGPNNSLGWDWAMVINPREVTVSKSLYEEELAPDWFDRLRAGEETLLESLS